MQHSTNLTMMPSELTKNQLAWSIFARRRIELHVICRVAIYLMPYALRKSAISYQACGCLL